MENLSQLYKDLVELQKQTSGATFIMGYSTRSNKHYIHFNNCKKRFEFKSMDECLIEAIKWVKGVRVVSACQYTLIV